MKALFVTPVIHVSDMENAVKYYTDVLGFKIDFEYEEYIGLLFSEVSIHLSGPGHQGVKKTAGNMLFTVFCDEIDAYYAQLQTKGAVISYPIGDRYYGLRDFSVDDPDGNTIVFNCDIAKP